MRVTWRKQSEILQLLSSPVNDSLFSVVEQMSSNTYKFFFFFLNHQRKASSISKLVIRKFV